MTYQQQSNAARAAILNRLRTQPAPFEEAPPRPDQYLNVTATPDGSLEDRFKAELERVNGVFYQVSDGEAAIETTLSILDGLHVPAAIERQVITWQDLPDSVAGLQVALMQKSIRVNIPKARRADRSTILRDAEPALAGITGADAGFATTGSLALVTRAAQGRLPSLLPPVHIALLERKRLYARVEDWLHVEGKAALYSSNSVVFITGPSRTSDIEMQTILGVHGPGKLHVILFG